jgi:hypothetical protein
MDLGGAEIRAHASLHVLIFQGKDKLHLFSRITITLPALCSLCIQSRSSRGAAETISPNLFHLSHPQGLTVSLQASPYVSFLALAIRSLPYGTRLHLDISRIHALPNEDEHATPSIEYNNVSAPVCSDFFACQGSCLKTYIPAGVPQERALESRREEFESLGYDLKICA